MTDMKYKPKTKTDTQWLAQQDQRVYESRSDGELARKRKSPHNRAPLEFLLVAA